MRVALDARAPHNTLISMEEFGDSIAMGKTSHEEVVAAVTPRKLPPHADMIEGGRNGRH